MRHLEKTSYKYKTGTFWMICITLACLSAITIIAFAPLGKKWLFASILGLIGIFGSFVIQKIVKHLLLFLAVFLIPLRIDFYLFFKPTDYILTGYPGFPITAFDIVFFVLLCHYLIGLSNGQEKFKFYPTISVPALLFLVLSGISAFKSADLTFSFANFFLMVKSYFIFLYFANRIKTSEDLSIIIFALCASVLFQSFIGALQYLSGGSFMKGVFGVPQSAYTMKITGTYVLSRVGGTVGHPNVLARYLCFCIPIIFCYVLVGRHTSLRMLAAIAVLGAGLTLILTLSRGSWAALGLASFYLLYKILNYYLKSRVKAIVIVLLLNFALSLSIFGLFEDVRHRLLEDDYGAAASRIPMAMVAWNIIKENPLSGVGLNNYTRAMNKYDRTRNNQSYGFPHPVHNSYLLIAAESGIPALAMFIWLIVSTIKNAASAIKRASPSLGILQVGWIVGLFTWLIAGLFDRDFAGVTTMLWFTIGSSIATNNLKLYK
jgi:O-antigen ligase